MAQFKCGTRPDAEHTKDMSESPKLTKNCHRRHASTRRQQSEQHSSRKKGTLESDKEEDEKEDEVCYEFGLGIEEPSFSRRASDSMNSLGHRIPARFPSKVRHKRAADQIGGNWKVRGRRASTVRVEAFRTKFK